MKGDIVNVHEGSKSMIPAFFIESRITNLTSVNMDVLNILFAEVGKETDPEDKLTYTITAEQYATLKDLKNRTTSYEILRDTVWGNGEGKGIDNIYMEVVGENKAYGDRLRPVSRVSYNQGQCQITFSPDFKEILVNVKKQDGGKIFAALVYTLPMKSIYSKRIYMMCKRFESTGIRYSERYDFSAFREKIGVPASYSKSMVISRAIEYAKTEINELTDIIIDYELDQKGIIFTIKKKNEFTIEDKNANEKESMVDKALNKEEVNYFKTEAKKIISKLSEAQLEVLINDESKANWKYDELLELIKYTAEHNTSNAFGYIYSIMNSKTGSEFMSERIETKKSAGSSDWGPSSKRNYDADELLRRAKVN